MPTALRIKLTTEEDKTLQELSFADNVPRRVKMRAIALRRRWENLGLGGLWEAPGRGGKRKWSLEDINAIAHSTQNLFNHSVSLGSITTAK